MKKDNCKDCVSKCEHAGKDREFVCIGGVSCKKSKNGNRDIEKDILGRLFMLIKTSESQEFFKGKLTWVVESDELLDFIKTIKEEISEGKNEKN